MAARRSPASSSRAGDGRLADKIAATQGEAFYRGELAEKMVAHARAHDGAHTLADFAAHDADWVTPLAHDYRGFTVHEIPPNGQGIAALMALGILEHFDLAITSRLGRVPASADRSDEARVRRRLSLRERPAHDDGHAAALLDRGYLAARARLIDPARAQDFGHGEPPRGGTVYLTAADESGMMVSLIQSNYMGFGSGVVVPGTGISLQNRGTGFSLAAGPSQPGRRRQAAVSHDHPRIRHAQRRAATRRSASWAARSSRQAICRRLSAYRLPRIRRQSSTRRAGRSTPDVSIDLEARHRRSCVPG